MSKTPDSSASEPDPSAATTHEAVPERTVDHSALLNDALLVRHETKQNRMVDARVTRDYPDGYTRTGLLRVEYVDRPGNKSFNVTYPDPETGQPVGLHYRNGIASTYFSDGERVVTDEDLEYVHELIVEATGEGAWELVFSTEVRWVPRRPGPGEQPEAVDPDHPAA